MPIPILLLPPMILHQHRIVHRVVQRRLHALLLSGEGSGRRTATDLGVLSGELRAGFVEEGVAFHFAVFVQVEGQVQMVFRGVWMLEQVLHPLVQRVRRE